MVGGRASDGGGAHPRPARICEALIRARRLSRIFLQVKCAAPHGERLFEADILNALSTANDLERRAALGRRGIRKRKHRSIWTNRPGIVLASIKRLCHALFSVEEDRVAKADRLKEEIGWLKLVFGLLAAADASLIVWLARSYTTDNRIIVFAGVVVMLVISGVILWIILLVRRRIAELEET
jgi:hypothetical protein